MCFRVLKQALKGSGSNLTVSHMTMMSLCGLFLLETSKLVDLQLGVATRSTQHTVRDAEPDVHKITSYLIEEKVFKSMSRNEPSFDDPFTKGAQKIAGGILKST